MIKAYRKMKFHRLRMFNFTANSKGSKQNFLDMDQARLALSMCLDSLSGTKNFVEFFDGNKKIAVEFISGASEFLKNKTGFITGKLSSAKDEHAYQIRTDGTSNERKLILNAGERFESRSYFVLDTSNMVVGYLYEQSAPSVYSLGKLVEMLSKENASQPTVFAQVTDISMHDMIDNLSKMAYIGTITGYYEIPSKLPVEMTGLSERQYKKLTNQKVIRNQVSLVVDKRGVSAFPIDNIDKPNQNQIDQNRKEKKIFFKGLSANKFLKKLKVNTKETTDSNMREVLLNNNPLVYRISFDYGKITNDNFDEVVCKRLKAEYVSHEQEIQNEYRI